MPLVQRRLQVSFSGASLSFGGSPNLEGLRASARVIYPGGVKFPTLDLRIWGMRLADMNNLSTIGMVGKQLPDTQISVTAVDDLGSNLVFTGQVDSAVSDFQGGANLPFHVLAHSGTNVALQNIQGTSVQGKADAVQMLRKLANQAGLQFESNNVSNVSLRNPWYAQGLMSQIRQICRDCSLDHVIDRGKLAISSQTTTRDYSAITGPTLGMIGYPSYSSIGIKVKMLFNPLCVLYGKLTVKGSAITQANGDWKIYTMVHSLDCFKPNGEWFTTVEAANPQNVVVSSGSPS